MQLLKTTDPQHESAFIAQRTGMATLAFLFPAIFIVSSLFSDKSFQTSLSAYYWSGDWERNFFVGGLCAVGTFLMLYQGFTKSETILLKLAGVFVLGVAFFPTDSANQPGSPLHEPSAILFFGCILIACGFMSWRSLKRLDDRPDSPRKKLFVSAYVTCFVLMILAVILGIIEWTSDDAGMVLRSSYLILIAETLGVWAFGTYWFFKTRELDPNASWMPMS